MPKQWTTANPRMGPEPKTSSAKPAINVVMLESKIVAQALSKPIAIAVLGATPLAQLFPNTLVNQHVRVNRHTQC
jgi:hypothetical protein